MLIEFIEQKVKEAVVELIEDGTYFVSHPDLQGAWANEKTKEKALEEFQSVIEDWLVLALQDGDEIKGLTEYFPKHTKAPAHA